MSEQVFISYRREGGDVTAGLICARLKGLNYTVFYDYDSLGGGCFDERIYDAIEGCNDFVLVLPPNSLDRCVNDDDWVRNEIRHALKYNKNIIPVMLPGFFFPTDLPADIEKVAKYNGVQFIMAYLDAVIENIADRLVSKPMDSTASGGKDIKGGGAENPLLKRAFIFLEDGDWANADQYCEKVLDIDPENAYAYLGKLLTELKLTHEELLGECEEPFDNRNNYKKIIRFADAELKARIDGYADQIAERKENERVEDIYQRASALVSAARNQYQFHAAAKMLEDIRDYKDASELIAHCNSMAEKAMETPNFLENNAKYEQAKRFMSEAKTRFQFQTVAEMFEEIKGYKDADVLAESCRAHVAKLLDEAMQAEIEKKYVKAKELMDAATTYANFRSVAEKFNGLNDYKDSQKLASLCNEKALVLRNDSVLNTARLNLNGSLEICTRMLDALRSIKGWKDADALHQQYLTRIANLKSEKAKAERIKQAKAKAARRKKIFTISFIVAFVLCAIIAVVILISAKSFAAPAQATSTAQDIIARAIPYADSPYITFTK